MSIAQRQKLIDELELTWSLVPKMRFGQLLDGIVELGGSSTDSFFGTDEALSKLNLKYRALKKPRASKRKLTPAALSLLELFRSLIVECPDSTLGRLLWNVMAWSPTMPFLRESIEDDDMILGAKAMRDHLASPKKRKKLPLYAVAYDSKETQTLVDELELTWKQFSNMRFGELLAGIGELAGSFTEVFGRSDEALSEFNLKYRALKNRRSSNGELTPAALSLLDSIRGLAVESPGLGFGGLLWNILAWSPQGNPYLIEGALDDDILFGARCWMEYRATPKAKRKLPFYALVNSEQDSPGRRSAGYGVLSFMFDIYIRRRFAFLEEEYGFTPSLHHPRDGLESWINYSRGSIAISLGLISNSLEGVDVEEKSPRGRQSTLLEVFVKKRMGAKVPSKRGINLDDPVQSADWYAGVVRTHIDAIISECGM